MTEQLDQIQQQLASVERRSAAIEARLDKRLPPIEDRLNLMDGRLARVEERVDGHDKNHHGIRSTFRRSAPIASGVAVVVIVLIELLQRFGVPSLPPY